MPGVLSRYSYDKQNYFCGYNGGVVVRQDKSLACCQVKITGIKKRCGAAFFYHSRFADFKGRKSALRSVAQNPACFAVAILPVGVIHAGNHHATTG